MAGVRSVFPGGVTVKILCSPQLVLGKAPGWLDHRRLGRGPVGSLLDGLGITRLNDRWEVRKERQTDGSCGVEGDR